MSQPIRPKYERSKYGTPCLDESQDSPRGRGLCADDPSVKVGMRVEGRDGRMWEKRQRKRPNGKSGRVWYWKPIGDVTRKNKKRSGSRRRRSDDDDSDVDEVCVEGRGAFMRDPEGEWIWKDVNGTHTTKLQLQAVPDTPNDNNTKAKKVPGSTEAAKDIMAGLSHKLGELAKNIENQSVKADIERYARRIDPKADIVDLTAELIVSLADAVQPGVKVEAATQVKQEPAAGGSAYRYGGRRSRVYY